MSPFLTVFTAFPVSDTTENLVSETLTFALDTFANDTVIKSDSKYLPSELNFNFLSLTLTLRLFLISTGHLLASFLQATCAKRAFLAPSHNSLASLTILT